MIKKSNTIIYKTYISTRLKKIEEKTLERIKKIKGVSKIISSTKNTILIKRSRGMDLIDYINLKDLSENDCKNIAFQLLKIIKKLHKLNIIHGDIKPENIIYNNKNKKITLIDFELIKNTPIYSPPETLKYPRMKYFTKYHDIWCIGTTIYTILNKKHPFSNIQNILTGKIEPFNPQISQEAKNFIMFLLKTNVLKRPSIDKCLKHKWFSKKKSWSFLELYVFLFMIPLTIIFILYIKYFH